MPGQNQCFGSASIIMRIRGGGKPKKDQLKNQVYLKSLNITTYYFVFLEFLGTIFSSLDLVLVIFERNFK